MLRLKGQTESGKWVEFDIMQIDVPVRDFLAVCINEDCATIIDPATIQPADDSQTPTRIKCSNCGQCFDTDIVGVFARCDNCQTEIEISSQPADDPRKAMLDEIRMISDRIKADFNGHNELACIAAEVFHSHLNIHLNRMEAKL